MRIVSKTAYYWNQWDVLALSSFSAKEAKIAKKTDVSSRVAVDRMIGEKADEIMGFTRKMMAEDISLKEWQTMLLEVTKSAFAVSGAMAGNLLEYSDKYQIAIARQMEFIGRFGVQAQHKIIDMNDAVPYRASMYAQASRGFHENIRRLEAKKAGKVMERRIRAKKDDNAFCRLQEEIGWMPIGSLPDIGEGPASMFCRCTFQFK